MTVGARAVEAVRESWLVEDRWWTQEPAAPALLGGGHDDGRDLVVYRDLGAGDGPRSARRGRLAA